MIRLLKNIIASLRGLFVKKAKENIEVVECSRSEFRAFLDNVYGDEYYNFEAYCDDLKSKLGVTGGVEYELSEFKYKDAPACFKCDLKEIEWVCTQDDFENVQYPTFVWVD